MATYKLMGGPRTNGALGLFFKVEAKENTSAETIQDTIVYTSMISRYFTPALYNKLGYMEFIAVTEDKFDLIAGATS